MDLCLGFGLCGANKSQRRRKNDVSISRRNPFDSAWRCEKNRLKARAAKKVKEISAPGFDARVSVWHLRKTAPGHAPRTSFFTVRGSRVHRVYINITFSRLYINTTSKHPRTTERN